MSWTLVNRRLSAFLKIPFKYNSPQNEDNLNWDLYRLSLARMRFLQGQSTHWRATCSYPINGIDFRDYLRGNFKDFNIIDYVGSGTCKKVEYINIRGHVATDLTIPFWQKHTPCILIAHILTVNLRWRSREQLERKTTLAGTLPA